MNLTAAFFSAGVWMIASAIWQQTYRSAHVKPGSRIAFDLAADILPAAILALVVAHFA